MIDLTNYSEDELSLNVFNDESLYLIRNTEGLKEELDERFIYTPEQLEVLFADLEDDEEELND